MEIIVTVRATTLNNKMIATRTPRTTRSALPFEIQQNTWADKGERKNLLQTLESQESFLNIDRKA